MQHKNNNSKLVNLLKQQEQSSFTKPRSSSKLQSFKDQYIDSPAFRISKKPRDSFVDSELDPYVMSPVLNSQSQGNLERVIIAQSKKIKKVIEQVQATKSKVQELEYRLSNKADGSRQTLQIIRNMQQQYSTQIMNIKSNFQERRIQEHAVMMKQKQKATALFLEVVRLGDALQKIQHNMKGMNGGVQNRLQYLEGKSATNDKNFITLAQKNYTGNDIVSQFADKVLSRVQGVENSLLILGKQHLKDKEQVSRIDTSTSRIAEDLNMIFNSMQLDLQSKLQIRVCEIVNKLIFEKEQRAKSQQQIKKKLDFKQRLLLQKQKSEKQQSQSRYLSMDTNIRNQFIRKDESIKSLIQLTQSQFKSLQRQIQDVNRFKDQSESLMKNQLKKIQEGFRKQYDMYKRQQFDLIVNIEEMIKVQIGTKLNTDIDLKNLTNSVATYMATDLNTLKEAFNRFSKETSGLIKQIQTNSTMRDSQLSQYIDQQISESNNNMNQKSNKLKAVFSKLTEQFRTHLLTTESNRKSIDLRLSQNQKDFDKLRSQVISIIDEFHKDLEIKLKHQRQKIKARKEPDYLSQISKLQEYVNFNIQIIKQGMQSNKKIITTRLQSMNNQSNSYDLRQLGQRVGKVKLLIQELKNQYQLQTNELKQTISMNEQKTTDEIQQIKIKVQSSRLKGISSSQEPDINKDFDYKLLTQVEQIKTALKRMNKQSEVSREAANDNFQKIHQDISIAYNNITQLENILKVALENIDEQIFKVKNDVIIIQGENKSTEEVIRQDIQKLLLFVKPQSLHGPN